LQSILIKKQKKKSTIQNHIHLDMKQIKNKTQLQFCLICHAEAHIINYGALSCYSCKTFFRRHSFHIQVCMTILFCFVFFVFFF